MIVWRDGVAPFAVEIGTFEVDGSHLGVRYDNAVGVLASFWSSRFHSPTLEPLLPLPSAVINNRVAS
jgi:hypothetical protein